MNFGNGEPCVFVDTNIVVCALTKGRNDRHRKARAVLQKVMDEDRMCLNTQVLQETFVTLVRKAAVSVENALADLEDLAKWPVFAVDVRAIREAGLLLKSEQISFWDALMVVAAGRMGAPILYTEDLKHGQVIGGVRVENPLIS